VLTEAAPELAAKHVGPQCAGVGYDSVLGTHQYTCRAHTSKSPHNITLTSEAMRSIALVRERSVVHSP
jgi:hypothetical protein